MIQLEDQLRAYAEGLVEPEAIGALPDGGPESAASARHPRRWSRPVLVAALVVLVVAAGAAVVSARHQATPDTSAAAITAAGRSAEFDLTVTVSDPSPAFGTDLEVDVVARNVTDRRLLVNAGFGPITLFTLLPATIPADGSYRMMHWSAVSAVGASPADPTDDPQRAVAMEPGETRTFTSLVAIDDRVGPGPARLEVAPCLRNSESLASGGDCPGPVVTVPIEVGASADGRVTRPQALLAVWSEPEAQAWVQAIGIGGNTASATAVVPRGDGWRVVTGAIDGSHVFSDEQTEAEVQAFGGPGLIADVSPDGHVTIDWLVMPA